MIVHNLKEFKDIKVRLINVCINFTAINLTI